VDVIVGTTGRVRDFSSLKTLVLDEADRMLDLGFKEDIEWVIPRSVLLTSSLDLGADQQAVLTGSIEVPLLSHYPSLG
jgi:superfamily II DNA/RNA helicase